MARRGRKREVGRGTSRSSQVRWCRCGKPRSHGVNWPKPWRCTCCGVSNKLQKHPPIPTTLLSLIRLAESVPLPRMREAWDE